MENNRVIAEVENVKLDLEAALSGANDLLIKIKGYNSFNKTNKTADCVLYLTEIEEINEMIDKSIYNTLIRCRALSDILENEVKSFDM